MSKKFRLLMVLVLMTGLLGGLMSSSTVSADPIVGVRIQIPRIDMGDIFGTGAWSTKLQIQNVGANPTWAAVIYWGAYSDECPPNDPGILATWHYQGMQPNGIWTLTPPAGARSALVLSFADPWVVTKPDETTVGTGEPLAVTVDRWGPDAESYQLSSSYVGISEYMEGQSPKYYVPYVMYDYLNKLDTVITIQNSWDYCVSVWIWYKEQGNCEYQVSQHITELAPGEAIRVGPPAAVTAGWADVAFTPLLVPGPAGWLGSAYISAQVPLGIVADQMTLTTMANNQAVLLTFRGLPYKPSEYPEWDRQWYADLLYREISGWDASIQVQNLTQVSKPTFVTVDFMDQSGDEILFVGDWVCRNGAVTFYLPAITDLGVNHPFGYVGAAEIASVQQIDYPGDWHHWGEPIFALVDIKKRKLVDPITGLVRPTVKGENQGGAYNAHPYREKWNAFGWAMPFIAKEGNGVTSRIALRNNGNCNKFMGKIFFWDETGTLVGVIHTPWLMPKHLKIFDLAYQGFLYPGWVGAATFVVLDVEQLCDVDNDGHVDNEPIMPSIVVMNYGWAAELGIDPPATDMGDLTRIYEATPILLGNKLCDADLLGIVTDDNFNTVLEGVTVTVPGGWYDADLDMWFDAWDETGDGGMYEIEEIATYGLFYPEETCYDGVTAYKYGYLTAIVDDVCLDCGEDEVLDFALVCNTNTITGTVTQYVTPTITGGPPVEGADVTCTWTPTPGTLDTGIMTDTTDAAGDFSIDSLPKEVDIECLIEKDGYDHAELAYYFGLPECGEMDGDDTVLGCYAEVKAQVWNDLDGMGDLDENEPLLPGETCTLYNEDASVILDYATTDEYGICKFFVGEDVYGPEFDWLEGVQIGVGSELGAVPSVWPCEVFVVNLPL
jgi:hypothetical protein